MKQKYHNKTKRKAPVNGKVLKFSNYANTKQRRTKFSAYHNKKPGKRNKTPDLWADKAYCPKQESLRDILKGLWKADLPKHLFEFAQDKFHEVKNKAVLKLVSLLAPKE